MSVSRTKKKSEGGMERDRNKRKLRPKKAGRKDREKTGLRAQRGFPRGQQEIQITPPGLCTGAGGGYWLNSRWSC